MKRWWLVVVIAAGALLALGSLAVSQMIDVLKRSAAASRLKLPNEPTDDRTRDRLAYLAKHVPELLAVLREYDPGARITSGFRAPDVNAAIGGSSSSRHRHGLAVDFGNGWNSGGTYNAATYLRDNQHRVAKLRDVIAEVDHLHVELLDPFGELDNPGRPPRFRYELPAGPVDGRRFAPIA